jgi:hypothetical protein
MAIDERELAQAREHPRGSERRALLPYREELNDVAAYARLPVAVRDRIVKWVEIRRRLAEDDGLDHDAGNLADPLLPDAALRAHVLAGERAARGRPGDADDPGGDVRAIVARIRAG